MALLAAQSLCAAFFVGDVLGDLKTIGVTETLAHVSIEAAAAVVLVAAIVFETRYAAELLRRKAHLEHSMSVASQAVHEVIAAEFERWGFTAAEQDVAMFLVKGMSISEIAALRGSAEGTVKSHLNAIYRKSGSKGRGELLSQIIDTLMDGPAPQSAAA